MEADVVSRNKVIENDMYALCEKLFPICRSITGNGVRETLSVLNSVMGGDIKVCEVSTGTRVFDWTVPKEWNIKNAYIENSQGQRIIDFHEHNLHVVGYSVPVDKFMDCRS